MSDFFGKDKSGRRLRQSSKVARLKLKEAKGYLKKSDGPKFYESLARALNGYFSDKMNLEPGAVGYKVIESGLQGKVDTGDLKKIELLFSEIDYGRFSSQNKSQDMKRLFKDANEVIGLMERKRL